MMQSLTEDSVVNESPRPRMTREEALEMAVRCVYERRPNAAQLCMDPSFTMEREQFAESIREEFRKIIGDEFENVQSIFQHSHFASPAARS
jgi:hypothetical protein